MKERDEVAMANERHWDRMVQEGCGYTIPWLTLNPEVLRTFASGKLDPVPEPLTDLSPANLFADVEGKDVLCLANGGGQQSAVFGLLGSHVTVADLSQQQLDGDREAAAHYGYHVQTIQADMRDLSALADDTFDIVYGTAICYVPDIQQVYSEVARVLKPRGVYRTDWGQPAIHFVSWDGKGYYVTQPYCHSLDQREDGAIEFRHYMDDIFNGLLEAGLSIRQVDDLSRYTKPDPQATPGSWTHQDAYFGGHFVVVAQLILER